MEEIATLYFDYKINLNQKNTVTFVEWHSQLSVLAVATQTSEYTSACSIMVLDQMGEPLKEVNEFYLENNRVTALAWHPARRMLVAAFASGDIRFWNNQPDFTVVPSPHSTPIACLKWSQLGSRLVSADAGGKVIGWKLDGSNLLTRQFQCEIENKPIAIEFCCSKPGLDMNSLAKKAIEGDEKALDIFSAWRPKTAGYRPMLNTDSINFYIAASPARVHYVNEIGNENAVLNCTNNIQNMLHHQTKNVLIVILNGMSICHYVTNSDGTLISINKVKLNGVDENSVFTWAGHDVLACTTLDCNIRFWELETGNSYTISPSSSTSFNNIGNNTEFFTSLSYSNAKGVLCGGTNSGTVVMWKKFNDKFSILECWEEVAVCKLKESVLLCMWGSLYIIVLTIQDLYILKEHALSASYNKQVACVQTAVSKVMVSKADMHSELNTDLKIIGLTTSSDHVALWSGKTMAVYQITDTTKLNVVGTFNCECEDSAIYEQNLIALPSGNEQLSKILVYTLQGTIKQYLNCDGQPISLQLNNCFLVVTTITGMLHMWDFSRREAKIHSHPKDLADTIPDFGEVILARINYNGNKVSLTVANSKLIPKPTLYIWDVENNLLQTFDFKNSQSMETQFITSHYWDANEGIMLSCMIKNSDYGNRGRKNSTKKVNDDMNFTAQFSKDNNVTYANSMLVSLFVTPENGVIQQDLIELNENHFSLLGLDTPHFIVLKKSQTTGAAVQVDKIVLSNFEELSTADSATRNGVLKFSFFLSIGDLDSAFKTIHNINSTSVWSSLAKMCVKTKRLDVAEICLGNLKDARGVAVLRAVSSESQIEVRTAALALHLQMLEEAENLYKNCGRYDLLNKMYQRSNKWDAALSVAHKKDRIHLRNTYHAYARYLESRGNIDEAIKMYERANTHQFNVPRVLLNNPTALQKYIIKSNDRSLIKWWAQYTESTGNMELALKYYDQAKDYLSMVRILCFLENVEGATKIADSSGNAAASYHLARHYENLGQIEQAVNFFAKSKSYGNAIRICKEHGLDDQLWELSLKARGQEQTEAALHFEQVEPYKAVLLYQKSGNVHRALSIAFRYGMLEAVRLISSQLDRNSDKELLEKCADFLLGKDEYEQAIHLLTLASKFEAAVSLCVKHRINITEELAELLTPDSDDPNRATVLNQLAEYALTQGNYHLATQKYTQAGNKQNAMKALLKSGDTEKIIFFANVSRQREIYIMAANYLQTLDWQNQPELLKHIVNFYIKGKSPHLLANFYISCAQTEIDEYGNYEKSLTALNEASRCLNKNPDQYGIILEQIAKKIACLKRFLEIRRQFENGELNTAMMQARNLLNNGLDFVRKGDVYSLMIEYCTRNNDWNTANQLVLEMRKMMPNDNLAYYIPKGILTKLGFLTSPTHVEESDDEEDNVVDET